MTDNIVRFSIPPIAPKTPTLFWSKPWVRSNLS